MLEQQPRVDRGPLDAIAADDLRRFARRDRDEQNLIIRLARIVTLDQKVSKRERDIAELQARQLEEVRDTAVRPDD
jgi:hypothetical protein